MEEVLRAADNNNNNNSGNGGSGCAAREGFTRRQLVQKVSATMSDDQIHAILKAQGII